MAGQKIIEDFQKYIWDSYANWYVGITNDPKNRLFKDHGVSQNGAWIYRQADTTEIARDVEFFFLSQGCDGGSGGGDDDSGFVYAYKKTSSTNP